MVFHKGDYIHDHSMDVFIEVVRVQYQDAKRAKLKVLWWNLGYTGECWCIDPLSETIEIQAKDCKYWKHLYSRRREIGAFGEKIMAI